MSAQRSLTQRVNATYIFDRLLILISEEQGEDNAFRGALELSLHIESSENVGGKC